MELKTTDYTKSFFQFERLKDYQKDVSSYPGFITYRLKSSMKTDTMPIINLAILINQQYSSFEIRVEPNRFIDNPKAFEVLWRDKEGVSGLAEFVAGNRKNHQYFAFQIYDQLERECEFYLKTESGYHPILIDDESKEAFHITMIDYYGLLKSF